MAIAVRVAWRHSFGAMGRCVRAFLTVKIDAPCVRMCVCLERKRAGDEGERKRERELYVAWVTK